MQRSGVIFAVALALGGAVPAHAAWDRIGSVDFSQRDTHNTQYGNFGGSVEALALQARGSDMRCQSVMATFGNGQTRQIFRGELPRGQNVTLDLPGRERLIKRLDFNCEPTERATGRVDVSVDVVADVGRYQDEWRRSPDWQRTWSHMFNWEQNNGQRR